MKACVVLWKGFRLARYLSCTRAETRIAVWFSKLEKNVILQVARYTKALPLWPFLLCHFSRKTQWHEAYQTLTLCHRLYLAISVTMLMQRQKEGAWKPKGKWTIRDSCNCSAVKPSPNAIHPFTSRRVLNPTSVLRLSPCKDKAKEFWFSTTAATCFGVHHVEAGTMGHIHH